jgi:hypothetical protein
MDPRMKPGSDGSRPNSVLRRRRSRRLTNGRPASPGCARFLFSSCLLLLSRASPADPIAAASARFFFFILQLTGKPKAGGCVRRPDFFLLFTGTAAMECVIPHARYLSRLLPQRARARTHHQPAAHFGQTKPTEDHLILQDDGERARKRSCRSRAAPDLPRHLHDPGKLCPFDLFGHRDVLGGAGREPALRAQA